VNPWNLLLESLHSALIEELTARSPEPRPALGLPRSEATLMWPDPDVPELQTIEVTLGGQSGKVLLGVEPAAYTKLNCNAECLWNGILAKAENSEFPRRNLSPAFELPRRITARAIFELPKPTRVIWIPVSLLPGRIYLGIAL
jgi:hypothetical protein